MQFLCNFSNQRLREEGVARDSLRRGSASNSGIHNHPEDAGKGAFVSSNKDRLSIHITGSHSAPKESSGLVYRLPTPGPCSLGFKSPGHQNLMVPQGERES